MTLTSAPSLRAPGPLRALRRRLLTPSYDETRIAERGFHVKDADSVAVLETVGARFLDGYAHAVGDRTVTETERFLDTVEPRFRGFAAEGAGMGLAVLDALPFTRSTRVDEFLAGDGGRHEYMVLVGVGWAMARLPRVLWPSPDHVDPLLGWLALDGYGFHQAYFHTDTWVHARRAAPCPGWVRGDRTGYEARAFDHGVGRALWFVAGTDAGRAADLVDSFPAHRRGDLWAGVGLAATYAGGAEADVLRLLVARSGFHRSELAQGSAFAAEARVRADLLVPHVESAVAVLAGVDAHGAARVCRDSRPSSSRAAPSGEPAYETWRRRIGHTLTVPTLQGGS